MPREKFETERCTVCLHVFTGRYENEHCQCEFVDTRDYVVNPLTPAELAEREYYSKRLIKKFNDVIRASTDRLMDKERG